MCLQCVVEAEEVVRDIVSGYSLYVATNDTEPDDWPKGWYGLVQINDPDFVFPCDFYGSDGIDGQLPGGSSKALDYFYMTPFHGHRFIEACKASGWEGHDVHGHPELWFLERAKKMFLQEFPNQEIREKDF